MTTVQMGHRRGVIRILIEVLLLLVWLTAFSSSITVEASESTDSYFPESLLIRVYTDGKVDVEYGFLVDPSLVSIEIQLLGSIYENMYIINEDSIPLDYSLLNGKIKVYTLGSWRIVFHYTTADLTNKAGRVWSLIINSSIPFTVVLPEEATIISLSTTPTSITITDRHYLIVMPAGEQVIDYLIGIVGSRERATALISEAEDAIEEAKSKGADVSTAEMKLEAAKGNLEEGKYAEAESLAMEAKQLAEEAPVKTEDLHIYSYWILLGIVTGGLILAFISFKLRRRALPSIPEREVRKIDVQRILKGRDYLRLEDREAIEFIASAGGEVFEAELREKFKLPKSTVWRMVRRLKREGLVEVKKVGGQNLIRLIERNR